MVYIFILIAFAISVIFVFIFHRSCIKPAFYSLLVFFGVGFFLLNVNQDFKSITEHENIVNISVALCGKYVEKGSLFCGPEFTMSGIVIRVMSKLKINELSKDEINKIVTRAKEIKPLITDKTLQLDFTTQVVSHQSADKSKGMKAIFYSYHIYKTIKI